MAFQGSLKELPLPDIVQLVSVSGKTGKFSLQDGGYSGEIYLRDGKIVHAITGKLEGEEAVYEMAIWRNGDFVFVPGDEGTSTSVRKSNTNLLMEAARRIDEWAILSKRIPSIRMVPVFTNQSATTSVSLTPQEWGVISKIDERRTIEEIAIALGTSPFEACKLLYGLITSELLSLKENFSSLPTENLGKMTTEGLNRLAGQIRSSCEQLLKGHSAAGQLENLARLGEAEMEAGRQVDAVLDLIRSCEKLVSSSLGPNQAKNFLERVAQMMQGG